MNVDFQLNEEQKMLVDLAERMGREQFAPKAARWDRNHEYPHENVEALQMFGAAGYSRDLPLERMLRDVRMFQIGGGTSQAQLNMIARSIFPPR